MIIRLHCNFSAPGIRPTCLLSPLPVPFRRHVPLRFEMKDLSCTIDKLMFFKPFLSLNCEHIDESQRQARFELTGCPFASLKQSVVITRRL